MQVCMLSGAAEEAEPRVGLRGNALEEKNIDSACDFWLLLNSSGVTEIFLGCNL